MRSGEADAVRLWASSGAMELSGRRDGSPLVAPGDPAGLVHSALSRVAEAGRQRTGSEPDLPTVALLGERAALAGFGRRGHVSCGGAFRALACRDGWLGLSLPRQDDVDLVPALVESASVRGADPWEVVSHWAADITVAQGASRAGELGLACAPWPRLVPERAPVLFTPGRSIRVSRPERPLVVDLTSLWAGPLCSHLLGFTGCTVVKVESRRRPDGARLGPAAFFDLLHHGHETVAVDLTDPRDRDRLLDLLARADLVLESSRARGLHQAGIVADDLVSEGTSWLSITARGRDSMSVGFGDDVAVAGGLAVEDGGDLLPVGDALADPLTGVVAAATAAELLLEDESYLADVSMVHVAAEAAGRHQEPHQTIWVDGAWWVELPGGQRVPVLPPTARRPRGRSRPLGADTDRWLR